jgi:hypothetical protein
MIPSMGTMAAYSCHTKGRFWKFEGFHENLAIFIPILISRLAVNNSDNAKLIYYSTYGQRFIYWPRIYQSNIFLKMLNLPTFWVSFPEKAN